MEGLSKEAYVLIGIWIVIIVIMLTYGGYKLVEFIIDIHSAIAQSEEATVSIGILRKEYNKLETRVTLLEGMKSYEEIEGNAETYLFEK